MPTWAALHALRHFSADTPPAAHHSSPATALIMLVSSRANVVLELAAAPPKPAIIRSLNVCYGGTIVQACTHCVEAAQRMRCRHKGR